MRRKGKGSFARSTFGRGERRTPELVALFAVTGMVFFVGTATALAGGFPGQNFLPQNRAWEMVSPVNKEGHDVLADSGRVRISQGGNGLPAAAMFSSLGTFSTAGGGQAAVDYMSQRTLVPGTQGWSTHNALPHQEPMSIFPNFFRAEALYVGESSEDLSKGIFRSWSPLPGTPAGVEGLRNLYLRSDLRQPGSGSYQLLSDCAYACSFERNFFESHTAVDASTDFTRILFESPFELAEGVTGLFKSVDGTLNIVGYVPTPPETACTGVEPSCVVPSNSGNPAGTEFTYSTNVLSEDGTKALFASTSFGSRNLYMRDDRGTIGEADDTTVQVNASERATPGPAGGATFWDASPSGGRVFFTSAASLTEDAPLGDGEKLYMWSLLPDEQGHHLTYLSADEEPGDELRGVLGTLGISDDGSVVYFLQKGQIVAGQETLGEGIGIYGWREGAGLSFIGEMADRADVGDDLAGASHNFEELDQLGARVTADGRRLLISLRQPPAPDGFDHGSCPDDDGTEIEGEKGCRELYLYDAFGGGSISCVSCDPEGSPPSSPAFYSVRRLSAWAATAGHLNRPVTDDGRYVFFSTGESLVNADTNGEIDAYVFDTASNTHHLLSSGTSKAPSYFVESSTDGRDAFLITRERLSAWDVDTAQDLYDARIGGGVPEPVPAPAMCREDGCQPPPVVPGEPPLGSMSASNPKKPTQGKPSRCAKRQRKSARCAKKSRRDASRSRRASR